MPELIDQLARQRFAEEIDRPFSVIAPAGVGKTYAIVERVEQMLSTGMGPIALVTYTKKAAAEMQSRLEGKFSAKRKLLPRERIFIGTIHSLCVELMQENGGDWGLPPKVEVATNVETLWRRFCEDIPNPLAELPLALQERCWRYFERFECDILLKVEPVAPAVREFELPPVLNFDILNKAQVKGASKKTIERLQRWACEFLEIVKGGDFIMPALPEPPKEESPARSFYDEAFGAFERWRSREGMRFVRYLAAKFYNWRKGRGVYLYEDLIRVVSAEVTQSRCGREVAGRFYVILDEAQDASPEQLELLKKLARRDKKGLQLTMVGDPQQSIYGERASLSHYLATHRKMLASEGAGELTFEVTFRCAQSVVAWVNTLGGQTLLKPSDTQAKFVPLRAKPDAALGEVCRWNLPAEKIAEGATAEERDWSFARAFAREFEKLKLPRQQAHLVAILASRRDWLFKLAATLQDQGYIVQVHADSPLPVPAQQLLRAIVHLMAYPFDSFELIGLLREITALDDRVLAGFAKKSPEALSLVGTKHEEIGRVEEIIGTWRVAYERGQTKPLDKALIGILADIGMEKIIEALSQVYGESFRREWRAGLTRVLGAAGAGNSAREILQTLENSREEMPVEPGALQLMTMHKAKGLEWPVVILPYLNRGNEAHKFTYPTVDPDNADALAWKLPRREIAYRENFERLLYVAMTRAKRKLVLVDDTEFFKPDVTSAAGILGLLKEGSAREKFELLPELNRLEVEGPPAAEVLPEPGFVAVRKTLTVLSPSGLVAHKSEDLSAEERVEKFLMGGVDYGEAWHLLMNVGEGDVFNSQGRKLEDILEERLARVPRKFLARAIEELERLHKSELGKMLNDSRNVIRTEIPFFARMDDFVLDGRVDLLLERPEGCLIVDWKTDQMAVAELWATYAPQMEAYRKAFEKLIGTRLETAIYSTCHGKVIGPKQT